MSIKVKRHSRESHMVDVVSLLLLVFVSFIKVCNPDNVEACVVALSILIIAMVYKYISIKF